MNFRCLTTLPVHYKFDISSEDRCIRCSFDFFVLCLCEQITINELQTYSNVIVIQFHSNETKTICV